MYNTASELLRAVNKQRFLDLRTQQIKQEQQMQGNSVDLPAFISAENEYKQFSRRGFFDRNGFLKPIPTEGVN